MAMSNENYLTVAEYAAAKHITKQAVYKQLNNKLKEFLVVVDGKKFISKAALEGDEEPTFNRVEQPVEQQLNNQIQPFLESQIEEKDRTIERLLLQIEKLQEQNGRLTELLHNSQVLLAAEKKLYLEQEANREAEQQSADIEHETILHTERKEKRGIWGLFRKK